MYDELLDEDDRRQRRDQTDQYDPGAAIHPGANTGHGPWAPGYDPGPNFGDGTPPRDGALFDLTDKDWTGGKTAPGGVVPVNDILHPAQPKAEAPRPAFQAPAPQQMQAAAPQAPGAPAQAAPAASYKTPAITDEVTRILMARIKELQNPGDVGSDPLYQNAVKQYQIASLRSADQQRKSLAERSAAGGTRASGGFNVGVAGINEKAGEKSAQYRSGLAMDRLSAREQQLVSAIQMARAVGQDDIANQLEIQRLQLQSELGRGDLALRGELGRGQLGLGYDQLGFSYADMVTRANRDAVLAGLGQ